jgi:hemerythrin superfamily protein
MRPAEDLITVLTEDHQEIRQLFTELEYLSGGEALRHRLSEQLIIESVRHSMAEEIYLYPLVAERLPDGDAETLDALAGHRRIERILRRLERPDLRDDRFASLLSELDTQVREHHADEEGRLFPRVARLVSEEELVELGRRAMKSKANAPSRPSGHNRPLLQMLLESGAGLVDRVRVYLSGEDRYPGTR